MDDIGTETEPEPNGIVPDYRTELGGDESQLDCEEELEDF